MAFARKLTSMGHKVLAVPTVAGGMNAIQFHDDGRMTGAACWRADGTPIGIAGGLARAGVIWAGVTRKPDRTSACLATLSPFRRHVAFIAVFVQEPQRR